MNSYGCIYDLSDEDCSRCLKHGYGPFCPCEDYEDHWGNGLEYDEYGEMRFVRKEERKREAD